MSRQDRAKQFMPFAALKGYEMALREKERVVVDKIELTEDSQARLDYLVQQVKKNDMVKVVYFYRGEYLEMIGMVARKDELGKVLKVVNTNIPFTDIYELEIVKKYCKK